MNQHKTRLMTVSAATLALVVAGTAAVAAHGPRDEDRFFGERFGPGMWAPRDGLGTRGQLRAGIMGQLEDFERREVSTQTADGITSFRVEQGVVDGVSDSGLDFSLGSGEAVSVVVDEDTDVITVSEQTVERGRWSRERLVPEEIELSEIEVGDGVIVWSDTEDGSDYVASRIVIQPPTDEDESTDDEAAATEGTAEEQDAAETDDAAAEADDAAAATDA